MGGQPKFLAPAAANDDGAIGRRPNGFMGLSLNDRTILFLVFLLDKTVSVGLDSLCITTLDYSFYTNPIFSPSSDLCMPPSTPACALALASH